MRVLSETAGQRPGKSFEVGTLRYTVGGLGGLFFWLLWGDFAFTFFENVFGRFIPLYLKEVHASNTLIGVMTGSFSGLVNVLFLPSISQWSDRFRSRMGRRIPFLYVVTPLTVVSLVSMGFAPEIGVFLHKLLPNKLATEISETSVILALVCALVVAFHFFNMVLVNCYNWLLHDVVPQNVMARFLSWFRIVGAISTFLFLRYIFPHLMDNRQTVFLGVGVFYLGAFMLMCKNVKEGGYPPPLSQDRPGFLKSFGIYIRKCLSLSLYRNFFLASILVMVAGCTGPFSALFAKETLGLDMLTMGTVYAWGSAISAVAYFPMGWLCDKFSPIRVVLVALPAYALMNLLSFWLINDQHSFLLFALVGAGPSVAWGLGSFAVTMMLFPGRDFGLLSSGLNVFGCGVLIVGNYAVGAFMDMVHSDYRMTFVWSAAFYLLAIFPMIAVCRGWKQHGGPHHYEPPLPD